MMIQKTKKTAMPSRIALEGREGPVPLALASGFLQVDHRRLGRATKAEQEFRLLPAGGLKALDGQASAGCSEPFHKRDVEALMALVHCVPLSTRRRHMEQLDFVSAAGHRIGEPVDGLFDREPAAVGGTIKLDAVNGAHFAAQRRGVRQLSTACSIAFPARVILGGQNVTGDRAQDPRTHFEIHLTEIAPAYDRNSLRAKERMNRAVAFRPRLAAQDHFDHADVALRLGINSRGKIEKLCCKSTPMHAKLGIPLGVEVLF